MYNNQASDLPRTWAEEANPKLKNLAFYINLSKHGP